MRAKDWNASRRLQAELRAALVVSYALGGQNAAVVIRKLQN